METSDRFFLSPLEEVASKIGGCTCYFLSVVPPLRFFLSCSYHHSLLDGAGAWCDSRVMEG